MSRLGILLWISDISSRRLIVPESNRMHDLNEKLKKEKNKLRWERLLSDIETHPERYPEIRISIAEDATHLHRGKNGKTDEDEMSIQKPNSFGDRVASKLERKYRR